jgi:hypothetical protein
VLNGFGATQERQHEARKGLKNMKKGGCAAHADAGVLAA